MFIRDWSVQEAVAAETAQTDLLTRLLTLRGFDSPEKVQDLLEPRPLSDPFLIKDMGAAVERIQQALDDYEKIAVYGDYDADGVTATAILYTYLKAVGGRVSFYIPSRDDGYGLNKDAIVTLYREGVELIVTVDNGISAVDEIAYAKELGIDVVVTDHHLPHSLLPAAHAIVDPHQEDDDSPFQELSGAGLALMLVLALAQSDTPRELEDFSGLAAIGTIADVVPLLGENRSIVRLGLIALQNARDTDRTPGLNALLNLTKADLNATGLAFSVVPYINAVGRMGSAERAVRLLTCRENYACKALAKELQNDNASRKDVEQRITERVITWIEQNPKVRFSRIIVAAGRGWHHGVLGIVAARITEHYGKPCFVLSVTDGVARGSGRSVEGFSLFNAVQFCAPLLTQYGGHPMAAGITMEEKNLSKFRQQINQFAAVQGRFMPVPSLSLDCVLEPHELTLETVRSLRTLEPFGCGNPQPVFGVFGVTLQEIRPLGATGNHCKLVCAKNGCAFECLRFGVKPKEFPYTVGAVVDLALNMDINFFRNVERLSLIARDVRLTGIDAQRNMADYHAYEAVHRGESEFPGIDTLPPSREELAAIYKLLRKHHMVWVSVDALLYELLPYEILLGKLLLSLDAFQERGLAKFTFDRNRVWSKMIKIHEKVDIFSSPVLHFQFADTITKP